MKITLFMKIDSSIPDSYIIMAKVDFLW